MITLMCKEGILGLEQDDDGTLTFVVDGQRRTLSDEHLHWLSGLLFGVAKLKDETYVQRTDGPHDIGDG